MITKIVKIRLIAAMEQLLRKPSIPLELNLIKEGGSHTRAGRVIIPRVLENSVKEFKQLKCRLGANQLIIMK